MLPYEEIKKYFRFVQRKRGYTVYKKELEELESTYWRFSVLAKEMGLEAFISYFSKAEIRQTQAFMKGGCGHFAGFLDLLFGDENSGFAIMTIGDKSHESSPDEIISESAYEKMDLIGVKAGYSHVLYKHEGKYYDACGVYDSAEAVLEHCKRYYADYLESAKEELTGHFYVSDFSNQALWPVKGKDEAKKKGLVHYLLSQHTNNLFTGMAEMLDGMKVNITRNEECKTVFRYETYRHGTGW